MTNSFPNSMSFLSASRMKSLFTVSYLNNLAPARQASCGYVKGIASREHEGTSLQRRGGALVAEEMTLRELRRAHKRTQKAVAKTLQIGQDQVSRLEQRSDLLISTLRGYVEAMGGRLSLVAEFPDRKPVIISGVSDMR